MTDWYLKCWVPSSTWLLCYVILLDRRWYLYVVDWEPWRGGGNRVQTNRSASACWGSNFRGWRGRGVQTVSTAVKWCLHLLLKKFFFGWGSEGFSLSCRCGHFTLESLRRNDMLLLIRDYLFLFVCHSFFRHQGSLFTIYRESQTPCYISSSHCLQWSCSPMAWQQNILWGFFRRISSLIYNWLFVGEQSCLDLITLLNHRNGRRGVLEIWGSWNTKNWIEWGLLWEERKL